MTGLSERTTHTSLEALEKLLNDTGLMAGFLDKYGNCLIEYVFYQEEILKGEKKMVKDTIRELLLSTGRKGISYLVADMVKSGFFEAPASGSYHLCKEGGLAEHSLNVYKHIINLAGALQVNVPIDSLIIVSLLHDIGKNGDYGKANYVPNIVRSKTKNKETGEYDLIQSTAKPYETNKELAYIPHEVRSIAIAERFIQLTEEEEHAIYYHNGKYTHIGYDLKETPLQMILHFADLWASRVTEKGEEE